MFFLHMQDAIDGSGSGDFDIDTEVIRVSCILSQCVFPSDDMVCWSKLLDYVYT